ncbi:hypothetical protein N431DRAFT_486151 [Stipitochalara longipes BDJ]|nr:hypothetical protein N431DRAFT_486151 [Stipitochalara longipes BDJ]
MGQVAKRFTFGYDSSSSNNTLQHKSPSKMLQTSILRYVISDLENRVAQNPNSILLRLPYDIRRRIYEYAGLTDGHFLSLNYEYPSSVNGYLPACDAWHELTPQDDDKTYHDEHEVVVYEEVDKIETSECEYKEEQENIMDEDYCISEYSQHISPFLDGRMPPLELRFNREKPRCCKVSWEGMVCSCESDDPMFPSPLLDVCRQVSNEVAQLFYSRNHFNVCQTNDGGFSGLLSIRPTALSWLTSLSIELSVCECADDSGDDNLTGSCSHHWQHHVLSIPGNQQFLRSAMLHSRSIEMTKWKTLCQHLAASVTSHQLKLWIICEVNNIETAKEITAPLTEPPVLRLCSIRLNSEPFMTELQDLARDITLKLTSQRPDALDYPFRYLDLPREIQLHILQYTDLVANNDIAWCSEVPYEGPQIIETSSLEWKSNGFSSEDFTYQFKCCGKCSDIREICSCFLMHTAYSTACVCWRMPSSLFLVSHQMREDSTAVFFSRNHFVILPLEDIDQGQPLEILQFFFQIRHTWKKRVSFTIDLSFQARRRLLQSDMGYSYYRPLPISELEEAEWDTGLLLAASMAKHKEWKNVYFHLSWPWHNPHNRHDPYTSSKEARDLRKHQEAVLEQQVMGPDYIADCKYNRRHAWNGYHCNCENCADEDW